MLPRPFTCCCAVLAIASGFFLYAKKHQTTLLDQRIAGIVHETEHVRAQTAMLRTEWTLENQPERLTSLAAHHTAYLRIMEPTQFVRMADLSSRLPAPVKENAAPVAPLALAEAPASPQRGVTITPAPVPVAAPVATTAQRMQPEHVSIASNANAVATPVTRPQPERPVVSVASAAPVTHPAPAPVQHVSVASAAPAPAARVRVADAGNGTSLLAAIQAAGTHHTQPAEAPRATARTETASEQADTGLKARVRVASAPRGNTADEPAPIRHPLPATVASWHPHLHRAAPAAGGGYMEARASSRYMGGSLLGGGGDSLPPPVPVTN